jgi:hypothetical protein
VVKKNDGITDEIGFSQKSFQACLRSRQHYACRVTDRSGTAVWIEERKVWPPDRGQTDPPAGQANDFNW